MVTDPVGDFVTQIMNAGAVRKSMVSVPYSKLKHAVADALVTAGYLKSAEKRGKKIKKTLDIALVYQNGTHVIRGVRRISKPGRRMYVRGAEIHRVKFGSGRLILSTPIGVMTGEEARKQHVGGEQLFTIW